MEKAETYKDGTVQSCGDKSVVGSKTTWEKPTNKDMFYLSHDGKKYKCVGDNSFEGPVI